MNLMNLKERILEVMRADVIPDREVRWYTVRELADGISQKFPGVDAPGMGAIAAVCERNDGIEIRRGIIDEDMTPRKATRYRLNAAYARGVSFAKERLQVETEPRELQAEIGPRELCAALEVYWLLYRSVSDEPSAKRVRQVHEKAYDDCAAEFPGMPRHLIENVLQSQRGPLWMYDFGGIKYWLDILLEAASSKRK